MVRPKPGLRQQSWHFLTSIATLATWRWRQQWFLLLVTGVGMIAAIILVCSLPLLSSVMLTAGLRSTVGASPESSQVTLTVPVTGLSTKGVQQATSIVLPSFRRRLGAYLQGSVRLEMQTPTFSVMGSSAGLPMSLYGVSLAEAASHLVLSEGHLPDAQALGQGLEVVLTDSAMQALGVHVGSTLSIQSPVQTVSSTTIFNAGIRPVPYLLKIPVQVVGRFHVRDAETYWHGNDFEISRSQGKGVTTPPTVLALVSSATLLRYFDSVAAHEKQLVEQGAPGSSDNQSDQVYFVTSPTLYYYTALDPANIDLAALDTLVHQLAGVQADANTLTTNDATSTTFPYIVQEVPSGQLFHTSTSPSILEKFQGQLAVVQVPTALLTLQIACLILFFVSVMADLLVDRQAEIIAVLRSRGASGRQVLGSLATQGLGISLLALLIAPLLALLVVYVIAARLLPQGSLSALDVITRSPVQAWRGVLWYALLAGGVALLTMLISLYRAARLDILSVRREASRSIRRPLWQRLRLDLWGLVVALTGYGFSLYLMNTSTFLDTQAQVLVSSPLSFVAPIFLLLAGVLAFFRFFPVLLRMISAFALRGRSASSMLALAQMARAPRQPLRMSLLLGLATAFTIFALIFFASQVQRAQDLAAYQVGSDFFGSIPLEVSPLPLAQETAQYRQIAGVSAVSAGYVSEGQVTLSLGAFSTSTFAMQIRAIDTTTLAQTLFWNSQNSAQSLPDLLALLQSWQQRGIQQGAVPALVDASAWNGMHLHVGSTFSIVENNAVGSSARYLAVAEIEHIPTVDDNASGGVLVDFTTMQQVEAKNLISVPLNTLWLRTSDEPAVLAHVRGILTTSRLHLDNLSDRRALLTGLAGDPLTLDLLGILSLGTGAALLLALVANILTPLLSVRARLTSFAVLRALGAEPRQVVRVLAWEQGLIFLLALVLGCLFGGLISLSVVPNLLFSGILASTIARVDEKQLFAIQQLLPTQIIVPLALGVALLVLLGICVLALVLIGRVVLYPMMGQALRINED